MEHLRRPLAVCRTVLKNRIVVPPISDFGVVSPDGLVTGRHLGRYTAFAEGGAGLIILEACSVLRMREKRDTLCLEEDVCIEGLSRLAQAIHAHGAASLVQIMLTGLAAMGRASIADIPAAEFLRCRQAFVSAAIRCRKAGFDGIELHAAHGMYLDEVVETSTRHDGYGGCFENRVRLLVELVQAIKAACGAGFIVAVRFGNSNDSELVNTALAIEQAGADLLDVSSGMEAYSIPPSDFRFDRKIYAASLVKRHTHLPVICVGGIFTGAQGEEILNSGCADLIAVGRGHLSDPAWARKVLAGETPNPCLRCKRCLWYQDGRRCPAAAIYHPPGATRTPRS